MAFYTLLTTIGAAKLANAQVTGTPVQITHFAVGDGNGAPYNPAQTATELSGEVYRAAPNQIYVDASNANWLVIEAIIPETVGGWYVREAAIFDVDGDMIAIASYPETYKPTLAEGSGKDLYLRMILEFGNTGDVTLKIDPAIVLATRQYVAAAIADHGNSRNHPLATPAFPGMVELATSAETQTGADSTRAITPAGLVSALPALVPRASTVAAGLVELATNTETQTGADSTRAITPAGLVSALPALVPPVPPASTVAAGLVELATNAETQTGSDGQRAVTPAGLASLRASTDVRGLTFLAANAAAQAMSDADRAITPANLGALFHRSLAASGNGIGYQAFPGGMILQWGIANNIPVGSTVTVTLPLAFPTSGLVVLAGLWSTSVQGQYNPFGAKFLSESQISIRNGQGLASDDAAWLAIGF